jgi:hypothetical protein
MLMYRYLETKLSNTISETFAFALLLIGSSKMSCDKLPYSEEFIPEYLER